MSLASFLKTIVETLDACGIPHMVAGSMASTHHGRPRTTQDVDIVIEADVETIARFVEKLPPEHFYVSREAAKDAIRQRSMFNVIDLASGWKVDLITRKDREFSRTEFSRRQPARILGVEVFIATAEDTVIAKLEWARRSGSERQLRDVAAVIEVIADALDTAYVDEWVGRLGLDALWTRLGESDPS